ncbi:MAG: hypothetical protein KDE53_34550, partial [Caldilineaceae bacterium]|nr:hypothetical protein [Caldilineaceae bacterium]
MPPGSIKKGSNSTQITPKCTKLFNCEILVTPFDPFKVNVIINLLFFTCFAAMHDSMIERHHRF